jgi:pimeloyl-ACP methyl ester carboxylesterase
VTAPARRTVAVAGRPASWLEAGGGAGPALVLVHGAGGAAELWEPQLRDLAGAARVIAVDLPGHGPLGGRGCPSVALYAGWLLRFLAVLDLAPVVLAGHSMGGAIAQTIALERPGALAGLVLVGTGARLRVLARILELLRQRPAAGRDVVRELSYARATPAERVAVADRVLRETAPLVTLGDFLACDRFDVMARLGTIAVPTLVLTGDEDRLTPPAYGRFLAGAIPGARLVDVPGAGHFPHLEQPGAVTAAIRDFLAALPTAGGSAPGAVPTVARVPVAPAADTPAPEAELASRESRHHGAAG